MRGDIALVGRMGAGKTTIANLLSVSHNYTRIGHADAMKELAREAYGPIDKTGDYEVTRTSANNPPWQEKVSGRIILQQLGQTVKQLDRDLWVKITLNRTQRSPEPVVNDDTRFIFEADLLRDAGFTIVHVDTPEPIRMQRLANLYGRVPTEQEMNHESEREVGDIKVDLTISGATEPWASVQQLVHELGLDEPDKMLSTRWVLGG